MEKEITGNSKYVRFDWAIKRILRDKANFGVLEGLISVLIKEPVTITEILESENNKWRKEDKDNRVDVKAKTEKGETIIVEVQLTKETDFFQRILFGTAAAINDQISIGEDYQVIKKIYSINILYFDFGVGDDYAYHGSMEFHGMTKEGSVLRFNTKNEQTYIHKTVARVTPPEEVFPEYFLLRVNQFNEVAKTPIEEWMAYLKDGIIRDDTTDPGLQEARQKLNVMKMSQDEYRAYRDYMVSVHASQDALDTAKADGWVDGWEDGWEDGRAKGFADGFADGKTQGMAQGREEGMAQGREESAKDIALSMKKDGVPVAAIAKYTGLTEEEIARL